MSLPDYCQAPTPNIHHRRAHRRGQRDGFGQFWTPGQSDSWGAGGER
jgi:hypothetical protein